LPLPWRFWKNKNFMEEGGPFYEERTTHYDTRTVEEYKEEIKKWWWIGPVKHRVDLRIEDAYRKAYTSLGWKVVTEERDTQWVNWTLHPANWDERVQKTKENILRCARNYEFQVQSNNHPALCRHAVAQLGWTIVKEGGDHWNTILYTIRKSISPEMVSVYTQPPYNPAAAPAEK
jgi:hypothetical protein